LNQNINVLNGLTPGTSYTIEIYSDIVTSTLGNIYLNNGANPNNYRAYFTYCGDTPGISGQPSSTPQTICQNGTATGFSITALGNSLSYQWYQNSGNSNTGGTAFSGATSSAFTPPTSAAGTLYYYCIVSGTCSSSITSSASGAVIVNAPPSITTNPASVTVCPNTNTSFSVAASGSGTLSYQWYLSTDGLTFNAITSAGSNPVYSGFTGNTLTLTGIVAGNNSYQYKCVVSGPSPCTTAATSTAATLTVTTGTNISAPSPLAPSICSGKSASFTVTGGGASLSYQWMENGSNINGSGSQSIYSGFYSTGGPTSTLNISSVTGLNNYAYSCVVSGSCGSPASSGQATLTVIPAPSFSSAGASIYSSSWTTGQNDDNTNGFGVWNLTTSGGNGTFFY